jgi:hypothetical protein
MHTSNPVVLSVRSFFGGPSFGRAGMSEGTMESYFDRDIIYSICLYLDLPDIFSFKLTNHFYYNLIHQEIFWLTMIHHRAAPHLISTIPHFISEKWALKFLHFLKVSSYFEVYCFFHQIPFPFIGSYGKIISLARDSSAGIYDLSDGSFRGGLMKISCQLSTNTLSIESSEDQWLYEIQYRSHQIIACDSHSNHIYTIRCCQENRHLSFYDPLSGHCAYRYHPLSLHDNSVQTALSPLDSDSCLSPSSCSSLSNLSSLILPPMSMLYNGVYGPHGTETIYLAFERLSEMNPPLKQRLPSRDQWDSCEYVVTGRKITGDANVPAQQLSFILNPRLAIKNLQRIARG